MSHVRMAAVLTVASVVLGMAGTAPARAEFFGRNDRPGKVLSARSVTDDDLHFLQQIGLRWARLEYDAGDVRLFGTQPRQQRVIYSSAPRYSHYR